MSSSKASQLSIADVPDDVVLENVLVDESLDAKDLCALSRVSRRFTTLSAAPCLWQAHYNAKWGPCGSLAQRAAKLAGGWKAFYGDKHTHERTVPAGLSRPSSWELKAFLEKLTTPPIAADSSASSAGVLPRTPATTLGSTWEEELDMEGLEDVMEMDGVDVPRDAAATNLAPQPVAVVFLLDGSGSVNEDEFSAMGEFVLAASEAVNAAAQGAQVAVVQFSNDVRMEFEFGVYNRETLADAVRRMVRMNGGTNVSRAIQRAAALLKPSPSGTLRQVVLLTDGRVDRGHAKEARAMAERLADEQSLVSLFALGVGRGVERTELRYIIGGHLPLPAPPPSHPALLLPPAVVHSPPGSPPTYFPVFPHHQAPLPYAPYGSGAAPLSPPSPQASMSHASSACMAVPPSPAWSMSSAASSAASSFAASSATAAAAAMRAALRCPLSACGEGAEERYLDLLVREEAPY